MAQVQQRRLGGWRPKALGFFLGSLGAYAGCLIAGIAVMDRGGSAWQRWAFGVGAIAFALFGVGVAVNEGRRSTELDRVIFSESSSIAFFATMLAVLTYGLLERFGELPRLSMWNVWYFGMGTWAVTGLIFRRRMS